MIRRSFLWRLAQFILRPSLAVFFKFKVYHPERVPAKGGVLLAPNHFSFLDPLMVGTALNDRPIGFFANAYLFRVPILGFLIRNVHAFPVEKGKGDRAAVASAIEKLRERHVVNVFPEGTRSHDGRIAPLQRGFALMARKAKVPVVPVAIDGSYEAWPRWHKIPRLHPVHIMFGQPIDSTQYDNDALMAKLDEELRKLHEELVSMRKRSGWPARYLQETP